MGKKLLQKVKVLHQEKGEITRMSGASREKELIQELRKIAQQR